MTLHSTAFAYAETPSRAEKELMTSWLDMFRDTITCPSCKAHFTTLLEKYRVQFPNMLQNRHEFVMFTFRAHNAVNKRIHKPVYASVEECMVTLRGNVKNRKATDYRVSYINHITRYWRTFQDVAGIVSLKKINEMKRIEIEYISARDTNFAIDIRQDVVVLPQSMIEGTTESQPRAGGFGIRSSGVGGFQLTSRGLRLRL